MTTLQRYRDDGPLGVLLGRIVPAAKVGPALLIVCAILLGAALAVDRDAGPVALAALGSFVIAGGASTSRPLVGRADWLVPTVLRLTEYGGLIAMAARWHPEALPAVYAALFAVSTHQYETVYRLRHLGLAPPRWVSWAALGWEGRLIVGGLILAGGLPQVIWYVFSALAVTLFVGESASAWARASRSAAA